ncbi:BTB/POZ and TAZ domain-containing protein 2-like [Silene latifolia]|uniref:BTB/POZ and TAZ domain-containing protein 2-like n=1 Tax=Silene latifolia TaxID=37657 RepID=UPI003D77E83C
MCPTKFSVECPAKSLGNFLISDKIAENLPKSDVVIVTSSGLRIPAHSHILAMVSPVMENVMEKAKRNPKTGEKVIKIPGVPSEAVSSFVQFLYSSSCTDEEIDKYGMHLLALSHVFSVPKLKQRCTKGLAISLTIENVIDVLQLARLCDAPDLHLKGMKLVLGKFRDVKKTEGWRFVRKNDPWLELDVLQYIDEVESRKKRTKRHKEEQRQYLQLSEAMDCLVHICTEGCTSVGPYDMDPNKKKEPCKRFATCHGLQMLIRHFATCKKRVNGGCSRCKRMWQLLRLHASMCEHHEHCRVPLCRQFKMKMQQREKKAEDAKWKVLVKKVLQAKTVSSLALRNEAAAPHQVTKHSCDEAPLHGFNAGA